MAKDLQLPNLPKSTVADRISDAVKQLKSLDSPLGFGLWDTRTADCRGEVMDAIKGTGGQVKHIKDGYQYVGGFPAHMWRLATNDDHYKTLRYGIKQFRKEWEPIRKALVKPYHYVSIGPGTGEKDRSVLQHLQSMATTETIVYVPVDISSDLLRMGLDNSMEEIDDRVEVLPVELDITDADAVADLKTVLHELIGDSGMLLSLLGNTLANFRDDRTMLKQIASLMSSPNDLLFIELATTTEADVHSAKSAAVEYEGSKSFREFALATLLDYTDLTRDQGQVEPSAEVIEEAALQITTRFTVDKVHKVELKDGDHFDLQKDEPIELYISRKYSEAALQSLYSGFRNVATNSSRYRNRSLSRTGFGITMDLLELADSSVPPVHPVAGEDK